MGNKLSVIHLNTIDNVDLQKELRGIRAGTFCGVIIAGKAALDAVKSGLPTNVPIAICAYSEFTEIEMNMETDTQFQIFNIMTPLTEYSDLISVVFPNLTKVAVIHKTDFEISQAEGISTKVYKINSWKELKSTVTNAIKWCDVVWLPADPAFTSTALAFIIKESLQHKTPLLTSSPRIIKGGAVAGLVRSPLDIGKAAAKWLESSVAIGSKATANMDSVKIELVNNPKVARFLGIAMPSKYDGKDTINIADYK
jgi:ABC-type uncharacterized transport system substrate-binding protein